MVGSVGLSVSGAHVVRPANATSPPTHHVSLNQTALWNPKFARMVPHSAVLGELIEILISFVF